MKICLHARQEKEYLDRADEIIFEPNDYEAIPRYAEQYPNCSIVLQCPGINIDWERVTKIKNSISNQFILALNNFDAGFICKSFDLDFYYSFPITSYDQLNVILDLKPYYVRLGSSLFFDMDNIHTAFPEAKIRLIPNIAYVDPRYKKYELYGTWIRPEDLELYEKYGEIIEFDTTEMSRERALFRIYIENRTWPGELSLIIDNFDYDTLNGMILPDVGEKRLNCRQKCLSNKSCKICKRVIKLANPEEIQRYKDSIAPKYTAPKEEELKDI